MPVSRTRGSILVPPVALGIAFAASLAHRACAQCYGDLDANGTVDGNDLGALLAAWGPGTGPSDLNVDGFTDGNDLGILLAKWGACAGTVVPSWSTLLQAYPDPAVVTSAGLRNAILRTGRAWRVRDDLTQVEMLLVPPGTFAMGCSAGSDDHDCATAELPVHQVTLTGAFYLGRYEITQAQWQARMGSNPSQFQGRPDSPSRPVERVSPSNVQAFVAGSATVGMRLPTEAEWEFACRAGTLSPFHDGSSEDAAAQQIAWIAPNSGAETRQVGTRAPNRLGFHDMLGNVAEMVSDRYGTYPATPQTDPMGPATGTDRVLRGGSWADSTALARSSARVPLAPTASSPSVGFRLARRP